MGAAPVPLILHPQPCCDPAERPARDYFCDWLSLRRPRRSLVRGLLAGWLPLRGEGSRCVRSPAGGARLPAEAVEPRPLPWCERHIGLVIAPGPHPRCHRPPVVELAC